MTTTVGPHDPIVMSGGGSLGFWIECECGWISSSFYTESGARGQHGGHRQLSIHSTKETNA